MNLILLIAIALSLSGPVDRGTARAIGNRGAYTNPTIETVRQVQPSDHILIVFEDGSWALDEDGIFPYDITGCYDWGICE